MATVQDFQNYRMGRGFPSSIYSSKDDASMRKKREMAFLNRMSAFNNTPEQIAARVAQQQNAVSAADSFGSAQEDANRRQINSRRAMQGPLSGMGINYVDPRTIPSLPNSTYGAGQATGKVVGDVAGGLYDIAGTVTPPVLDAFADTVEGVENFGRGALGMSERPEGQRFSKGDDFNPFNYKGALQSATDFYNNQFPQKEVPIPEGLFPRTDPNNLNLGQNDLVGRGQGALRPLISDMGGQGVLRGDSQGFVEDALVENAVKEVREQVEPVAQVASEQNGVLNQDGTTKSKTGVGALTNIAEAASVDREGTTTGNKRNNTSMNIPRTSLAEKLIRMGGAIMGASERGGLAAMNAGTAAYGALADEDRRLQQQERENIQAENQFLLNRFSPSAKQMELAQESFNASNSALSDAANFENLADQLVAAGDSVTGLFDGTVLAAKDNATGNPRSLLRLGLQNAKVQAALKNVAQTKGAISNREMELFLSPLPSLKIHQEGVWIAWLRMQAALARVTSARLQDRSNLNADGSLIQRRDLNAGATNEVEQLYAEYERQVGLAANKNSGKGSETQISKEDEDKANAALNYTEN